jgi:hypothetical protein
MALTLATLRQEARDLIGDTSAVSPIFTTQQIDSWINAAIRDLNNHFPRTIVDTLSTTAGTHVYDLPQTFIAMIKVEYPTGDDPPSYLKYRSSKLTTFWNFGGVTAAGDFAAGYYDILRPQDADSLNPPQIVISANPGASETITYTAKIEHNQLTSSSDETTIPDRLTHLIPLYVRYKAWQELSTSEGMDPDPIKLLAATQEVNSYRAERAYYKALDMAKKALSESEIVEWRMPGADRIY